MKLKAVNLGSLVLLIAFAIGSQAQKGGPWASARERGLKGVVQTVVSKFSDISGSYETTYKYEFARNGKLLTISSPQFVQPDCIITAPVSQKITKRNRNGDVEEVSTFMEGDVIEKERYEYAGNWIKTGYIPNAELFHGRGRLERG